MGVLERVAGEGRVLLAVASPGECEAVARGLGLGVFESASRRAVEVSLRFDLVRTGLGKANAAGGVARALDGLRHAGVLSLGVSGALPGSGLSAGAVVVASACVLADDGVETPGGFVPQSALGFPAHEGCGERFEATPGWVRALTGIGEVGVCASVSSCSGTGERARAIGTRTGALCEDMESAAVGLVAARVGKAFACVRVISNRTGDRAGQGWDLGRAFSVLGEVAARL